VIVVVFLIGLVLGVAVGWHARTHPAPDDTAERRRLCAALDALDRIDTRRAREAAATNRSP